MRRLHALSYPAPSTPVPIGTVATTRPTVKSEIAITPLRQPLNSRWCSLSIAIETGCRQGAVDQRRTAFAFLASISTTSLVSVRFA
jgi:hypothetical protein